MPIPTMIKVRMTRALEINEAVPANNFDMDYWQCKLHSGSEGCYTVGCFIGNYAATNPEGLLDLIPSSHHCDRNIVVSVINPAVHNYDAVAAHFGLLMCETEWLFSPMSYNNFNTKQQLKTTVLERVRTFIATDGGSMPSNPRYFAWAKEMTDKATHQMQQISDAIELDHCVLCGGFEGGLTTHCSGVRVSADDSDRVYKGLIDYRDGKWVNQPTIHMSHAYGTHRVPLEEITVTKVG